MRRNGWVVLACKWVPRASRLRGAELATFSMCTFRCEWINVVVNSEWLSQRETFFKCVHHLNASIIWRLGILMRGVNANVMSNFRYCWICPMRN